MLSGSIQITDVDRADGKYKGTISLEELYKSMKIPYVHYCPAAQRGLFDQEFPDDIIDYDYNTLFPINYKKLMLEDAKVFEMAVLLLKGELVDSSVLWNVRKENDYISLEYNEEERKLSIYGTITIPDSAHRHKAYFTLFQWRNDPDSIPKKVVFSGKGVELKKEEIIEMLNNKFNPYKRIFITVLNELQEKEGEIFRQMNMLTKKANTAQMIRVTPELNPTNRFIKRLVEKCSIFSISEIENNRTTIHKNSRKLVPNSTLATAINPFSKDLAIYEQQKKVYDDLISFIDDFFNRLADFYKEMAPDSTVDERHKSRKESYIISNIMFGSLFRIAFEVWKSYHIAAYIWMNDARYISVINSLTKDVTIEMQDNLSRKVNIMSKENTNWIGKIANDKFQITNNRLSQQEAYKYLSKECNLQQIKISINEESLKLKIN